MPPPCTRPPSCIGPLVAALLLPWCMTAVAQSVEFFSPQGEVKSVRQVTARFAQPMVSFGDPREVDPFAIDCVEKGKGRWADMKNWVYDFDRDLPAGVRCSFTVKPGITGLDGSPLAAGQRFEFTTGGPAIVRGLPEDGSRIDENQMFILGLDAPVAADTIVAHAHCIAAGVNEKIGVRLVTGEERKTILENRKSFAASYLRLIFLDSGAGATRGSFLFRLPVTGSDEEKFLRLRDAPDSPLVTLACARTLPPNAEVKLVWGKGIASSSGVPTSADQALAYRVRSTFRASFSCERVNKDAQCIPIQPLRLSFTAPVAARDAVEIRLVASSGRVYHPQLTQDDDAINGVAFGPGVPENETFRLELPSGLKDDAGRTLANASSFPLKLRTDENPPLAKFPADFGILERVLPDGSPPLLPVTLRNVEASLKTTIGMTGRPAPPAGQAAAVASIPARVARVARGDEMRIIDWLWRFERAQKVDAEYDQKTERWIVRHNGHAVSMFHASDSLRTFDVPKPNGDKAFEVVGIALPDPGFYVVELASPKLGAALNGNALPYFARTTVLVTNLGVHFKLGRESSLVWVTRLADGKPMRSARVEIRDCSGHRYWEGSSDASGIARIDLALPDRSDLPDCPGGQREFFVTARAGDDLSFALSSWGEGISPWRFNVPTGNWNGPYVAHAVLDRPLFRAGETVSMKLFIRRQTGAGFSLVPGDALGDTLTIRHQGSEREYTVPVHWDGGASGTDHGEATFAIPKDAALGRYGIAMHDSLGSRRGRSGDRPVGQFRVEAFRVPLMRARLQPVGVPLVNPTDVQIDLQVSYLSGGGAGGLPVKLRTQIEPKSVDFADFEGYSLAAGDVTEGRDEEGDTYARFDDYTFADPDYFEEDEDAPAAGARHTTDLSLALDAEGGARATVKDVGKSSAPRDLVAELEYRDPNGETLTSAVRATLWPSRIVLGLKPDSWVASKDRVKYTVVAVDLAGKPVAGVPVQTDVFKRETYSHRRRLIGGFYAYEHGTEIKRLMDLCAGTTDAHGLVICEVPAPGAGNLILRARATDGEGNVAVTRADAWVATGDDWWFAASDNDRIDLLPEKKHYDAGDTARFQLRTPFKEATVLVTLEREGVLDAFVRTIKRSNPVLEVPIKGSYAPNVFVSAFAVRGRVGGVEPTALIDLAKPSYKMGLTELRVGWSANELVVKVTPTQAAYKVRDKASVAIAVRRLDGSPPPAGSEVALAAVDEGLLELLPNDTWKLLDAMMTRRGEEVETSTAQTQVIGKRHFGKKAIAAGGGGGRASARELFDTLLLWRARVALDAAGNAVVEIPLNDSLTSFRIVAIASSGADLFGTGDAAIRSTQDLMLLSGLPPVVRESDHFRASFTVRNASERRMQVQLTARFAVTGKGLAPLEPRQLELAPGEARDVAWDVTAPIDATKLDWRVEAVEGSAAASSGLAAKGQPAAALSDSSQPSPPQARDEPPGASGAARDAIKVSQLVLAAIPERTYQATMLQLESPLAISVQRPSDAIPGRGGVKVRMQAKLAGDLPGVDEYLSRYPYSCFEQQASVAVGLRNRLAWNALMSVLPEYLDRDGMVKYWPLLRLGSDALTAYVLSVADEAGWEIPDDSRRRMEAALVGFVEGRLVRDSDLQTADLTIRKVAALEALSRRSETIDAKWLDSIAIEPNLWPTSTAIDWYLVLKRSPKLPQRDERMKAVEQILRSRLNFQGTTMGFSTERTDALWWLMVSADSNANRLLLALLDAPAWKEDMPRLVTGALGRMRQGHWNTTVANAWGVLAVEKFSAAFESDPVSGTTSATLATARYAHVWAPEDGTKPFDKRLVWPPQRADLALVHDGGGKPWITLQSIAAIPLQEALSTGYKISREITAVQQQTKGKWSRGDVARVHLEIEAQSDMTWVVVDDPIPAGSTALGRGLGADSALLAQGEVKRGVVWPAYEERTFTDYRAYFRYVPKGRFALEYTVRLNNPGQFHLPTTRVEAMYAPEMFGELPNADWTVLP
jgi:uncharacterized protein YfaS (alpha-2-macroglobulin family)